jgi:uncharacterized protein
MLMGSKKPKAGPPWKMAAVLAVGLGVGFVLGLMVGGRSESPPPTLAQVEAGHAARSTTVSAPPMPAEDDDGPPEVAPLPPSAAAPMGKAQRPELVEPAPALLEPPPPISAPGRTIPPAWVRFAVPPPPRAAGRPMIAIVIDDLGLDRRRTERTIALPGAVTLSFMTYAQDLDRQTAEARAHGHELLVHMPMEPMNGALDTGPNALRVGLPPQELQRRIEWGLSRFQGFVGINNHMGSRFTADAAGMSVVMADLHNHGLMFLDSVTTEKSVGAELARRYGVPFAARQVFLDNEQSVAAVRAQLDRVEAVARKTGYAIAIGHPHDTTLAALDAWLPTLAAHGFALVPVTAIVAASGVKG